MGNVSLRLAPGAVQGPDEAYQGLARPRLHLPHPLLDHYLHSLIFRQRLHRRAHHRQSHRPPGSWLREARRSSHRQRTLFEFCAAVGVCGAGKFPGHSNWSGGGGVAATKHVAEAGDQQQEASDGVFASGVHGDILRGAVSGGAGAVATRVRHPVPVACRHRGLHGRRCRHHRLAQHHQFHHRHRLHLCHEIRLHAYPRVELANNRDRTLLLKLPHLH